MKIIGINSGTSIDGVDIVLVEYEVKNDVLFEKTWFFEERSFEKDFKDRLEQVMNIKTSNIQAVCSINFEISKVFAKFINEFIEKNGLNKKDIDLIATHGQTVWHNPIACAKYLKSTLQLGDLSVLSYLTKIDVVGNFRTKDMASDGQGAPLMPIYDFFKSKSNSQNLGFINLGGISNMTYLKKSAKKEEVVAFDMGPANLLIDKATKMFFNQPYDKNGDIARSGKLDLTLFNYLKEDEYLNLPLPKSTGREKYSEEFFRKLLHIFGASSNYNDLVHTLTYYTAYCIKEAMKFIGEIDVIFLSGGGALNSFLVDLIGTLTKVKIEIDSDYKIKEAKLFSYLGYLYCNNLKGNLISVTNAEQYVILGNFSKGE